MNSIGAREMEYGLFDTRDDGEYNDDNFVEKYATFTAHGAFLFGTEPFDRV